MKTIMKKNATSFSPKLFLIVFISIFFIFSCRNTHENDENENAKTEENDKYDEAAAAQQFEFERTKDPALGYVPKERLLAAYDAAERSKQIAMRSRITTASWVERGPTADFVSAGNGNKRYNNGVASGRIKAIWVDNADASGNTVWVGGIGGGLWKTTNFKTAPATWTPVNDFFTNLAIGSICQDPTNSNIMYFGTGEKTYNYDAIRGGGVWKSTDHGLNWSLLSATTTYLNVSKVLCDALGNLYVGVLQSNMGGGSNGLYRSTDGGSNFTDISASGVDPQVSDFVISSTGKLHVCFGYESSTPGYRYAVNPATVTTGSVWSTSANPLSNHLPETQAANEYCVIASKGDTLYAMPSANGVVTSVYKSTDGGSRWATINTTLSTNTLTGFCPSQGWYCLGIDVNPNDASKVIIGSLNCFVSTNGGSTFTQKSDWVNAAGTSTGQYVHCDVQIIKWTANNDIFIGSDGGIFYSGDAGVTYSERNSGLNIKQFNSCDFDPGLTDYFLAGAQDNGTHKFTSAGLNTTAEVTGGDGGTVHIDQDSTIMQYGAYTYNQFKRSSNAWSSVSSIYFYKGTSGAPSLFGSFINPSDFDNARNIMYSGADAGEFFRWSNPQSTVGAANSTTKYYSSSFPAEAAILTVSNLTGKVSAVTASTHTANRLFLGTTSGKIMRIDNANTFTSGSQGKNLDSTGLSSGNIIAAFPAGTISSIAIGSDDNHLMVTFSNFGVSNIWVTTNALSNPVTWTAIDGNLPDMPVRCALYDPTSNTKAWIATETGVWSTAAFSGGTTSWTASPGFPTVRTDMIKYRSIDQTLIAATHGRGLWTQTSTLLVLPINNFVLRGNWKSNSTVELLWDYTNAATATFEIESSTDGTYFTKTGSSLSVTTFLDQPGSSDIYYRVKGKNIFGNVSYSNVIHLQKGTDTKDITGVKIYPNPVKDNINMGFAASGEGIINYQITGINGQACWKQQELISGTGDYLRSWNMQALKPGTYVFTTTYNTKKISQKFIKL